MKAKIILSSLMAMIISFSFAQFDIPPGGIPGFPPDNSNCPGGAWCHPNGAGMSLMSDSKTKDVSDAFDNPSGCYGACTLGKVFLDIIRPFYPDCYPNCNIETESGSSESAQNKVNINKIKPIAAKTKITGATFNYLLNDLPKSLYNPERKAIAIESIKGSKFKLTGMWVYFEKAKNEIRLLRIQPVDSKTGASYDRIYLMFNKEHLMIMNQSWMNGLKMEEKKK